jgi:hypothetical protein
MKRGDFVFIGIMLCIVASLLYPASHAVIMSNTAAHPYAMGFIKFAILASMGELFAIRILGGNWSSPCGMIYRVIFYGFMGITMVTALNVYAYGVPSAMQSGILWGGGLGWPVVRAFWTSVMMNTTYGPVIMSAHRISDTYIDLDDGRLRNLPSVKFDTVLATINWHSLVVVVLFQMLTFFWIPAHTVTFMLPPEYRVLCAAALSFVLGVILAFFKRYKSKSSAAPIAA